MAVFSHRLLLLTVLPLDCFLKPTVLLCPALSTALSVFSRTFLPSSTSGLMGDLALSTFVCVSRQNRQRDRLIGAHTNGNELLRIVSHNVIIWIVSIRLPISNSSLSKRLGVIPCTPITTVIPCVQKLSYFSGNVLVLVSFFFSLFPLWSDGTTSYVDMLWEWFLSGDLSGSR